MYVHKWRKFGRGRGLYVTTIYHSQPSTYDREYGKVKSVYCWYQCFYKIQPVIKAGRWVEWQIFSVWIQIVCICACIYSCIFLFANSLVNFVYVFAFVSVGIAYLSLCPSLCSSWSRLFKWQSICELNDEYFPYQDTNCLHLCLHTFICLVYFYS